jgi:cytochrome P450
VKPPGPPGNVLLGHVRRLERDRLGFLRRCAATYGDVVALRYGRRPVYFLAHPDHVGTVLVRRQADFVKSPVVRLLRPVVGDGLLTSDGEPWRRQRRLAQPAFHRARVAGYAEIMIASAERVLEDWRGDGEVRDVHAEMMRLTLDIVARTLFGTSVEGEAAEVAAAMETLMREFVRLRASPWPFRVRWPGAGVRRLRRASVRLDAIVRRIIDDRRRHDGGGSDLLSALLAACDEDDGSRLTPVELRDAVMTFFLAGHETTANALAWTWLLLARNPGAEGALADELAEVLGDRAPNPGDLPRLRYAERAVREALRLYPPAHSIGREAARDTEVGGYRVPAGTMILMSPWVMHRDPRFYDRPEAFEPDRWTDDLEERLPRFAYFPFGGGPRVCIGQGFAMTEAVLLLAAIARRYRLTPVSAQPVPADAAVTLRPRGGLPMRIERRVPGG